MTPKKQKRGESLAQYDHSRFVSVATQEWYQELFVKRTIVKEKGIEMPKCYIRDFEEIENKEWEKFITHLKAIILLVVWEFYVNAKEQEEDYVFVRSKRVWFSCITINEIFGLNDLKTLKYNSIMGEEFDA